VLRSSPEGRIKLGRAILQSAEGDDVVAWLEQLLRIEQDSGNAKAVEAVAALMKETRLPDTMLKEFVRRPPHVHVRNWQVIGPVAGTDAAEARAALEADEIQIDQRHRGLHGRIGWSLLKSPTDRVDLKAILGKEQSALAYAACWVHCEGKQTGLLKVTSDD